MVEFRILRGGKKINSRITTLDLERAEFGVFRNLLGKVSWNVVLKKRGMVDFQGSPSPRSSLVHPDVQETKEG